MTNHEISVDEAQVRAKAFEIWQGRGCPVGSPERDWFAALHVLSAERTASKPDALEDGSAPVPVRWLATPAPANAAPDSAPAPRVAIAANGAAASAAAADPRRKAKRARRTKR